MFSWCQRRLWPVLVTTLKNFSAHDGLLLSAAMAYYAAFSLFPLCLVLIAGLGYLSRVSPRFQDSQHELLLALEQNTSPWLADQLKLLLDGVQDKASLGGPIGLVTLVFGSMGIFAQIVGMIDRVWGVPDTGTKSLWRMVRLALYDRSIAFLMLLITGLLVVVIFIANLVLSGMQKYAVQLPGGDYFWRTVRLMFPLLFNTLLFTFVYKLLPKVPVKLTHALCGGLVAAVVWQLGQQAFASFVIGDKYSAYGVVGSFIALMVWTYYASAVFFLGAELVYAISHTTSKLPS